jgi:hypothetical protein
MTHHLNTWCYAYRTDWVSQYAASFKTPGKLVSVERVVDDRVAVVKFADGLRAPVLRRDLRELAKE